MNIVFVSHCNFLGQSAYHVHSIAKKLIQRGCSCVICVPDGQASAKQHIDSEIPIMDYDIALNKGILFADGNGPALIHCWTPREHVRHFTESIADLYKCPYIVHLEDNELEICKRYLQSDSDEGFDRIQPEKLDSLMSSIMIHPRRYLGFMQKAAGVTVLMDRLLEHVPQGLPALVFWPGYDEIFSAVPAGLASELRKKYGVPDHSFVVYYSGNFHAINQKDIKQLLLALEVLKARGLPLHFIKTGLTTLPGIVEKDKRDTDMTDLGFVPRNQLPEILAIADVVVQPGASDAFNDYRFPSKLPEALIAGKALILPRCNLGRFLTDGFNALITDTGTSDELADKILTLYNNPGLRNIIGANGRHFAMTHLRWEDTLEKISIFYKETCFSHACSSYREHDFAAAVGIAEQNLNNASIAAEVNKSNQRLKYRVRECYDRDRQKDSINLPDDNQTLSATEEIHNGFNRHMKESMRYVSAKIKNVVAIFRLLPRIIRFGGGIAGSAAKALRVLSREGYGGVKRRILFVGGERSASRVLTIKPDLFSSAIDRNNYHEWMHRYDALNDQEREKIKSAMSGLPSRPLISIIMPVYNPKPKWLLAAIESVRRQLYQNWELCIADDASTDKGVRPILEKYSRRDSRIKVIFRDRNGHISAASNSALDIATGDWIALMDHDDLIAEHALFWVADTIHKRPDACLVYSDEDKIDGSGRRYDPYFKSDWNEDLFYSHNMISHLGVYRADLLKQIGGFKEGLEGAQDYDLSLRCIERIKPGNICHIPRVLYHWRMHSESTARSVYSKPYAISAGQKALNDHFQRKKINARSEYVQCGYRVRYLLPEKLPLVSLIILTRNKRSLIKKCIEDILKKTVYSEYEIIIVDNSSDDPSTIQYLQELQLNPKIHVIRNDRPFNFSALNNAAVKSARGEIVGFLNNDLEVISPGWLSEMVSHAMRAGIGAVGARLWYPDDTLQHGGVILGIGGVAGHAHKYMTRYQHGYFCRGSLIQNFSAVTAACLVIQKKIYQEVGGFNEDDLAIAFNDIDFCLRLVKAGYRNVWTPYAELYHHESASRGLENTAEKQKRFASEVAYMKKQWGDILMNDPAYSPNLGLDYEDFSLAWPPRVNSL